MIGITILAIIACWGLLGFLLWNFLVRPYVHSTALRICLTLLLAVVWFVGPVFDEILGARKFNRLCREVPQTKFHGPVAVGPGVFFDEQGRPKWKNRDEFYAIKRETDVWDKEIFEYRDESQEICKWPMSIVKNRAAYFDRATGKPCIEFFSYYSGGGWIRKFAGTGYYRCQNMGPLIGDEKLIIFKK